MPSVTVALGASFVKVEPDTSKRQNIRSSVSRRGEVSGFSRKSRRRLLNLVNQIKRKSLESALFITLTYPSEYPDVEDAKTHLDTFVKRLKRRSNGCSVIWRIELQKRGAPHFHLIVLGVRFVSKDWLSQAWYEIVGSGDLRHLRAGTNVSRVRHFRQMISYASKYVAKLGEDDIPGRQWGVYGRNCLPITLVKIELDHSQFFSLKRQIRAMISRRMRSIRRILGNQFMSCSIYVASRAVIRILSGPTNNTLKTGLIGL